MRAMADEAVDPRRSRKGPLRRLAAALAVVLAGLATFAMSSRLERERELPTSNQTRIGINLFGMQNFYRQQVFNDLTAQTEWFSSTGAGGTAMARAQLGRYGWVRYLMPGQTAVRPLFLPQPPFPPMTLRCRFAGEGRFSAGGIAAIEEQAANTLLVSLRPTGAADDGAWVELVETSRSDPVRNLDCRESDRSPTERFHPEFVQFVQGFEIL